MIEVNDLAWLPERLRTGPIPDLNADLNAKPGRVVEVIDGWAMVEYPRWGRFGCPVEELTKA